MVRCILLASILLSGCGRIERIPVPVACVNPADLPAETEKPVLTGDAAADVVILAQTVLRLRNEVMGLRAAVGPCSR